MGVIVSVLCTVSPGGLSFAFQSNETEDILDANTTEEMNYAYGYDTQIPSAGATVRANYNFRKWPLISTRRKGHIATPVKQGYFNVYINLMYVLLITI